MTASNPHHSYWYRAWHIGTLPLRLLGFVPVLVRCRWTQSNARVGLALTGPTRQLIGGLTVLGLLTLGIVWWAWR